MRENETQRESKHMIMQLQSSLLIMQNKETMGLRNEKLQVQIKIDSRLLPFSELSVFSR
jgi:hypothetical protein